MDYEVKPGFDGWTYEDVSVARQRLIWWLSTHGGVRGLVYRNNSRAGTIIKEGADWVWHPKGTGTGYKVNPANGCLSTKIEG